MLPGAGFHRVASLINQNGILRYARFKRTPFLQEKSPLGKDFLRGRVPVPIPAMCSMAVLHYLSITSVFDSTLPSQKFINSIAGISGLTIFTLLLRTRF